MADLGRMFGSSGTETLLGVPKGDPDHPKADVVVLGADCATPYASVGAYCAGGPDAMRRGTSDYAGGFQKINFDLGSTLLPAGVQAIDIGNVETDPDQPDRNRLRLRAAIEKVLGLGGVPMLLGGDDSLPIPMIEALGTRGPLTILQIDAHIDWRDEVDGEHWGLSSTMRRASEMNHVRQIVQVGARGIGSAGQAELDAAQAWGADLIPMREFVRLGPDAVAARIPEGSRVAICFDCDALDPAIMPAVIAPTAGGLDYGAALDLCLAVAARAEIAAVAMVEFMPERDLHGQGARTAGQLLAAFMGMIAQQIAGRQVG